MRTTTRLACLVCLSWLVLPAMAASSGQGVAASPAGTWQWVHDKTGAISVVRVDITDGALTGSVLNLMNPSPGFLARNGNPPMCTRCRGIRHDRPIVGMVIVWGLHKSGNQWVGGEGLDPSNGKTYRVKLHLDDHGQKLMVRVYVGIPLFGRTLVWHRAVRQSRVQDSGANKAKLRSESPQVPRIPSSPALPLTRRAV